MSGWNFNTLICQSKKAEKIPLTKLEFYTDAADIQLLTHHYIHRTENYLTVRCQMLRKVEKDKKKRINYNCI